MKLILSTISVFGVLMLVMAPTSDGFAGDTEKGLPSEDEFVPLEKTPELIKEEVPVYPEEAKKQGIVGKVYLKVLVDKNGNPVKVKVAKSSGNELLDASALEAARKNKFRPGNQDGQAVAVWVTYTVTFTLGEGDDKAPDE